MRSLNLLIIFNPNAAYGRSVKKLAAIKAAFVDLGISTNFKVTTHSGHASELVATTELSGFDGVVAAGGDGTVFEVLNGLYEHPKSVRIPLGLLPIGTGNAFARDLGLQPGAWPAAIDLLHRQRTRRVDVGHVKTGDSDYYFLNVIGMGLAAEAGMTAKKMKFLGNTAYTLATLWQVLKLKSYPLLINIDGKDLRQDNILFTISNTRFTGTHFLIAPGAVIDDGLLDITLLNRLPRHRLLRLFPSIYTGRHVRHSAVSIYRARRITVHSPTGLIMGPDGEFRGTTPAEITCLPQDLEIFV